MTTLRKLLLTGNPLRTLRSSLVHGPTAALLKYLRSRLPTDEESAAATPVKKTAVTMAARASRTSKEISLSGLSLDSVPSETWNSSEVTKVNLSGNSIEDLPVELRSCVSIEIPTDGFKAASKLQILDLSGDAGSLPENPAFSALPELQEPYLRRMQISAFPLDVLNLQQIQILDLSQNCLQSIPESIKDLTSLTELNLIRMAILEKGTKAILKYLKDRIVEP